MAIVVVAIGVAVLLNHVIVDVKTTIRWVCAAVFLALALAPLVDLVQRVHIRSHHPPRWLAILISYILFVVGFILLVLLVIPPIVREVESLASQLPTYVKDFEAWANNNVQFSELNDKYNITQLLSQEASQLPAKLGDAAGAAKEVTVGILNNIVEAVIVLTLTFFLLIDGGQQFFKLTGRLQEPQRDRFRRIGVPIAKIVRSYVSVNVVLAALAGVFTSTTTWLRSTATPIATTTIAITLITARLSIRDACIGPPEDSPRERESLPQPGRALLCERGMNLRLDNLALLLLLPPRGE